MGYRATQFIPSDNVDVQMGIREYEPPNIYNSALVKEINRFRSSSCPYTDCAGLTGNIYTPSLGA
jgi:hypothetical protein